MNATRITRSCSGLQCSNTVSTRNIVVTGNYLGIDCGSVSLNLVLVRDGVREPVSLYRRTMGRPLKTLIEGLNHWEEQFGKDLAISGCLATGSGRELIASALEIPAVNEIRAHSVGVHSVNPRVRTIIEIGGQDSKFIRLESSDGDGIPRYSVFRMNEICAAGTGAFLDEQAGRLGITVESFGATALKSANPAPIAGRCAVFAKTDMIHKAQEGTPLPDILMGVACALVRNYVSTLIRGDDLVPVVSLQGGVMSNAAVVKAFKDLLDLGEDDVITPPHFKVLGAVGCALMAAKNPTGARSTIRELIVKTEKAVAAQRSPLSFLQPLRPCADNGTRRPDKSFNDVRSQGPIVMGLDIGSVSVKGVLIDSKGHILGEDYRLSRSRPLDTLHEVLGALTTAGPGPDLVAVTGSGRNLAGRLIDADLIVNEITAQAKAAKSYDPEVDTIVEIGGQDSKWISLEDGRVKDFEMNRVCAAGTGSFLMEQADRLGLAMGQEFSDAAFASASPVDLGSRCTVFMESDLIHHQNNGASTKDLAAGVCVSVVQNYIERVANNKSLGTRVLFLGGVAANSSVQAAFRQHTGRELRRPDFFKVSGALGAAQTLLEKVESGEIAPVKRQEIKFDRSKIRKERFRCKGCPNECLVEKYYPDNRIVFLGGMCDRWEVNQGSSPQSRSPDLFKLRAQLLDEISEQGTHREQTWGILRGPQFYEWFPFWQAFCDGLGISLALPAPSNRKQFEKGVRYLKVETCLPLKALAGQIADLTASGIRTIFHPEILTEQPVEAGGKPANFCSYIQASSQFFKGVFPLDWKNPVINYEADPDSFRKQHIRFARELGVSRKTAMEAVKQGLEQLEAFQRRLKTAGEEFLDSLGADEQALVVLGKPYHTADRFLNMNLGGLFHRLGIRAIPGDLYHEACARAGQGLSVRWKYQAHMIEAAREIASDSRLFPVMITFFGCGPDPFTVRHLRDALAGKPVLMLEMDEHASRAGMITRLEAFLDGIRRKRFKPAQTILSEIDQSSGKRQANQSLSVEMQEPSKEDPYVRPTERHHPTPKPERLFIPYMTDMSYGFAAAARCVGIDAQVLPPPDRKSDRLGKPHLVGGECYPFALILGDYLKLADGLSPWDAERSLFYFPGADACRMPQYPVYIDKIRRNLGYSVGVISDAQQGLRLYGMSERSVQRVFIRAWEGINAYDVLMRLFVQMRPLAQDEQALEQAYIKARKGLLDALSNDRVREGVEDALHCLYNVNVDEVAAGPVVAVTGDYYTRAVPFANNHVYKEIERLGGIVWTPPTFSDSFKLAYLKDLMWSLVGGRSREALGYGLLYTFLAASEFKVKGGRLARRVMNSPLDLTGRTMWKTVRRYANTDLSAGITAPLATVLKDIDAGADGVLNLFTLNCSYGTVVTAALAGALEERSSIPMLTLVYDGLKKTNEKTRLEAFMEQVHHRRVSTRP